MAGVGIAQCGRAAIVRSENNQSVAALAGLPVVFVTTAVILGSVALFIGSRQKHRARAEGVAD